MEEECPECRRSLCRTLELKLSKSMQKMETLFQTAFEMRGMLSDIREIDDSLVQAQSGVLCIIGNPKHANALFTRLCVKSLMPKMHGGLGSDSALVVDAGNCSDAYLAVNFARQYGFDVETMLQSIVVTRPFTIHQLAFSITSELPRTVTRHSGTGGNVRLAAVSNLFALFEQEPQMDASEAEKLAGEIIDCIIEMGNKILVIVTMHSESIYSALAVRKFTRRIYLSKRAGSPWLSVNVCSAEQSTEFALLERELFTVRNR